MLRQGPEPYAINCVLAYLGSWGLREVLLKADNEPAIQALVDAVRVKRGERTMVARVRSTRINRMVRSRMLCEVSRASREPTCGCCKRNLDTRLTTKSMVLPWLVRHAAYVLSRFVKRDGRSAWARLRGKECDSPVGTGG